MKDELLIQKTRRELHRTKREVEKQVRKTKNKAKRAIKRNVKNGKKIAKKSVEQGKRIAKSGIKETYDSYRLISAPIRFIEFAYRAFRIKMKK